MGIGFAVVIPALIWAWVVGGSECIAGAAVAGMAAVYGGMLYLDRTRCPKCAKRLAFKDANPYRLPWARPAPKHCPQCGVSFNDARL